MNKEESLRPSTVRENANDEEIKSGNNSESERKPKHFGLEEDEEKNI